MLLERPLEVYLFEEEYILEKRMKVARMLVPRSEHGRECGWDVGMGWLV